MKKLWGIKTIIATAVSAVFGIASQAAEREVASMHGTWARAQANPNASFLANRDIGSNPNAQPLTDELLSPEMIRDWRSKYYNMVHDYEEREHYGMNRPDDRRAYIDQMQGFAREIRIQIGKREWGMYLDKARRAAEHDQYISKLKRPLALMAAVYAISTGERVKFSLGEDTNLVTKTDVMRQVADITMTSPYVNTSIGFSNITDPNNANFDPVYGGERYRVSMSRPIYWGFNGGVSYGGTSRDLGTSVNREIIPHVAAEFDHVQRYASNRTEELVKVGYHLDF